MAKWLCYFLELISEVVCILIWETKYLFKYLTPVQTKHFETLPALWYYIDLFTLLSFVLKSVKVPTRSDVGQNPLVKCLAKSVSPAFIARLFTRVERTKNNGKQGKH